ncbi:hypothetical protein NUW58_g3085 [Xylaria curta]|uniref:Uncharacterized protein n=1 Tax=Xylaria curta TaxID=42375 RepID=A0ACC1PE58_9PEZI|nr:hypothetical protein NUW58_g3085 [Xylaria curta]
MADDSRPHKQIHNDADHKCQRAPRADLVREDDSSTLRNDDVETSLNTHACWNNLCVEYKPSLPKSLTPYREVDYANTSSIYESWELISVRPTNQLTSSKRVFGLDMISTYKALKDGYTGVRPIPSYTQAELACMAATAESEWAARGFGLVRLMKRDTYGQNLTRQIFELPACLPSKLGALLDCRFVATNKNPCVRREWKVVMLKPIFNFLTDDAKKTNSRGIRSGRQSEPIQKWLVIIRGQDTRFSDKGFATFNTMTNPWIKVDEKLQGDQKIAAEHYNGVGGQKAMS